MTADPKPLPRVRDSQIMRLLHSERTKECAITGVTHGLELHHVLPRAQGGDDTRANLVFLNSAVHARITANKRNTIRALGEHIRDHRPDTIEYLNWKLGDRAPDWMRRRLLLEDM